MDKNFPSNYWQVDMKTWVGNTIVIIFHYKILYILDQIGLPIWVVLVYALYMSAMNFRASFLRFLH